MPKGFSRKVNFVAVMNVFMFNIFNVKLNQKKIILNNPLKRWRLDREVSTWAALGQCATLQAFFFTCFWNRYVAFIGSSLIYLRNFWRSPTGRGGTDIKKHMQRKVMLTTWPSLALKTVHCMWIWMESLMNNWCAASGIREVVVGL